MTIMRMGTRTTMALAGASAMALLLAGCGSGDESNGADGGATATSTATAASTATATESAPESEAAGESDAERASGGECAPVTAAVEEAGGADGSPVFGVPRPDGWTRVGEFESEMIPLALANKGLTADGFAPTAVLTIEPAPVGGEEEFARQMSMVEQLARPGSIAEQAPGTTCGHESQVVEYEAEAPGGTVTRVTALLVSVPVGDGFTTAVLSIQGAEPDDADYSSSVRAMVDGFQVKE